jgi:hypothetical protein
MRFPCSFELMVDISLVYCFQPKQFAFICNVSFPFPSLHILFFGYFFGRLECVGHSFAYVAHLWFLRDVWIRTQSTAVASWRATDLATHPSSLHILYCFLYWYLRKWIYALWTSIFDTIHYFFLSLFTVYGWLSC